VDVKDFCSFKRALQDGNTKDIVIGVPLLSALWGHLYTSDPDDDNQLSSYADGYVTVGSEQIFQENKFRTIKGFNDYRVLDYVYIEDENPNGGLGWGRRDTKARVLNVICHTSDKRVGLFMSLDYVRFKEDLDAGKFDGCKKHRWDDGGSGIMIPVALLTNYLIARGRFEISGARAKIHREV
jgi:hypothetical protein